MKKIISIFLAVFLILNIPIISYADNIETDSYTEFYSDGSYSITTIETNSISVLASSTISKTKSTVHYNSKDEAEWKINVTGTFVYSGTSATCTASKVSYEIYNTNWKVTSAQASKSGAKAIGDFTVKYYVLGIPMKTVNKTLTLTCSNTGVCS